MRVKEQQVVQRRTNPDGSVVETLSVRRPSVSDPNRLGDLQKLSETVCKGKCQPDLRPPQEILRNLGQEALARNDRRPEILRHRLADIG